MLFIVTISRDSSFNNFVDAPQMSSILRPFADFSNIVASILAYFLWLLEIFYVNYYFLFAKLNNIATNVKLSDNFKRLPGRIFRPT